ncbi:hypothetical protein BXZ70DRAFT_951300 [Cristinia sonorae]|uniref:WW domain-containing protein n=1 Tax=Cristinia sonorae TaxID=1940300 RepID=A0A8K0XM23_9AGAR|nr:hypothetical protein BXZ70DRAFT_951300 [Cristinia sonorae]
MSRGLSGSSLRLNPLGSADLQTPAAEPNTQIRQLPLSDETFPLGSSSRNAHSLRSWGDPKSVGPGSYARATYVHQSNVSTNRNGIVSMPVPRVSQEDGDIKMKNTAADHDDCYVRPHLPGFIAVDPPSLASNPVLALPEQWSAFVRPNGGLYYYNASQRLVTSQDMHDSRLRELVESHSRTLGGSISCNDINLPADWELCVEIDLDFDDKEVIIHNYISHEEGRYFQLRDNEIIYAERSLYWNHVEKFCMHYHAVPHFAESDFLSELGYGATERTLDNKGTTYRFTGPQTQALIGTYRELKESQREGIPVVPSMAWLCSRTMKLVEETRTNSRYGTRDAAAARKPSPEESTLQFQLVNILLGFMFSGTHNMYRRRLMKTKFNNVLYLPDFRELLQELIIEWGDSNLLSTVFVAANVSFLAIEDLTVVQRTFSLVSSLFAMISIAGGMHHIWHHRIRLDVEVEQATIYLNRGIALGRQGGMTALACFLALPIASLLWSFYAFTGALTAYCIQSVHVNHPFLVFMLCVSCLSGITTVSFFWKIWVGWRFSKMIENAEKAGRERPTRHRRVQNAGLRFGVRNRKNVQRAAV